MFTDTLREIELTQRIDLDAAGNKPSFYALCAGYLRGFKNNRHTRTDDVMPGDKRMTLATRRLYSKATPKERAVMTGADVPELTTRERSKVFAVLCYKLAREAHLTATILLPDENERNDNND